jgi:hypothetical protein
MITDKPEDLEAQAAELERKARALVEGQPFTATNYETTCEQLAAAHRLRERAAQLRKRRTDGVRFG